jgi:two-component system chemotaxis sensor kinase CheA
MTDDLADVVREFLGESRDNLDQIDVDLVALENSPEDDAIIARIFRAIHTLKGTCGFLGFSRLEAVSHAGESVLSALRDEEIAPTPALTSVLLAMVDAIRELLGQIDATGQEGGGDHAALIDQLTALHRGEAPALDAAAPPGPTGPAPAAPAAGAEPAAETSIRVDVALLDRLMNLVGELVLARNQLVQLTGRGGDAMVISATQQLNLITSELQEGVMKTRMQPIGNVWNKFPRVVRDLARTCDKRVELVMEGETTELDKTLIEAIKDPLTHLVRNAVDHGIEPPDRRIAAGKPAHGRLLLRAFHEGGQVNIEVSDDGAGLDAERIRDKALERGLIGHDQAARMTERELFRLIFLPGFSTAAKITHVSGRGVGMDVVQTNIERIGGAIELQGTRGAGTTIKIKIPLTLAIIPALVVGAGGERYAIPQASLLELVRLDGDEARAGIEMLYGTPVYRLRGKLLPLIDLGHALGRPGAPAPAGDDASGEAAAVHIVVLEADDQRFGLVVQAVHDTEEIVVKPLGKHLKAIPVFAGATIMGDGRVALILDVLGLARRARVIAELDERARLDHAVAVAAIDGGDHHTLLLFRSPDDGRMAIPLAQVTRLEEFPRALFERVGHELLVQYRGEIMPVVELSDLVPERRTVPRNPAGLDDAVAQVVVFGHAGAHVGLIVEHIVDIVEDTLAGTRPPGRPGVLGAVVIAGRVTELLDVEAVLRRAQPGAAWAQASAAATCGEDAVHGA